MKKIRWNVRAMTLSLALMGTCSPFSAAADPAVSDLIHKLKSDDASQREQAAQALGDMGPAAAAAVNALQKTMNDDFPYVRTRSAEALAKIGPTAIPAFIQALQNPSSDVRAISASALGDFGSKADAAVPELVNALHDSESPVRERATHALEQIGPAAVSPLLQMIKTRHDGSVVLALKILGTVDSTNDALIPQMVLALENTDTQVRMTAAQSLAHQGPHHVPELLEALKSQNSDVRAQIADVLADVGKRASAGVPALIDLLNDSSASVRGSAARALGHMGSEAGKDAVTPLKKLLQDPDAGVVSRAREALTNLTSTDGPAHPPQQKKLLKSEDDVHAAAPIPVVKKPAPIKKAPSKAVAKRSKKALTAAQLIPLLGNPDEVARSKTMASLLLIGTTAIPDLTQALQDGTTVIRQNAASAFIQIDSTTAAQAFANCAKSGDLGARLDALHALGSLGPQAQSAVPTMSDLLKDPSGDIQSAAEGVLTAMGTAEAKKALDAYHQDQEKKKLFSLIKDLRQGGKTSDDAANALVKIGGPSVLPVSQILSDPRTTNRQAAAKVLNRLGSSSAPATKALINALDDSDADVRHQSAEALGKINSPEAKSALRFFSIRDKSHQVLGYFKH